MTAARASLTRWLALASVRAGNVIGGGDWAADRLIPDFLLLRRPKDPANLLATLDQVVGAVQFVFLFSLLAGLVVLYAAIEASSGERGHDLAVLRALGGRRRQLRQVVLVEFAVLGALAGLLAGLGASAIGTGLARWVFQLDYLPSPELMFVAVASGLVGVTLIGMVASRRAFTGPVVERLRGA